MAPGLPRNITVRQIIKALERDGFQLMRQKGSHRFFKHLDGRMVVVAGHHSGDIFPIGTLGRMLKCVGWTKKDLKRLGLI